MCCFAFSVIYFPMFFFLGSCSLAVSSRLADSFFAIVPAKVYSNTLFSSPVHFLSFKTIFLVEEYQSCISTQINVCISMIIFDNLLCCSFKRYFSVAIVVVALILTLFLSISKPSFLFEKIHRVFCASQNAWLLKSIAGFRLLVKSFFTVWHENLC